MKQNVVGSLFAIVLVVGALALATTLPASKIGALEAHCQIWQCSN